MMATSVAVSSSEHSSFARMCDSSSTRSSEEEMKSSSGSVIVEDQEESHEDEHEQEFLPAPLSWFEQNNNHLEASSATISTTATADAPPSPQECSEEEAVAQEASVISVAQPQEQQSSSLYQEHLQPDSTAAGLLSQTGVKTIVHEQDDDDEDEDLLRRYHQYSYNAAASLTSSSNNASSSSITSRNIRPSPSWKEISSQILPAAARELWSNSMHKLCHSAQLSYAQSHWHRQYTDLGQGASGFFRNEHLIPELPPFSSLPWVDRQLVREWRTYLPDYDNKDKNNSSKSSTDNDPKIIKVEEVEDDDFDRARTLVPQFLPRPVWQKAEICFTCRQTFGPARLRHHCRMCGYSFCQLHSSGSQNLAHLGYNPQVPERVCDACLELLLEQHLAERVAWRLARCRDYKDGQQLQPYFETGIDTLEDVALRITNAALQMAKSIPLGAQATVAVETVDVLRKHGLTGIYTIMLRREFLAAADLLRKTLGINRTAWPLSVHELSAAIFYALAQHRAMRGMNPEREEWIHSLRGQELPVDLSVSAVLENGSGEDGGGGGGSHEVYNHEGAARSISHLVSFSSSSTTNNTTTASGPSSEVNEESTKSSQQQESAPPSSSFVPVCDPVPAETLESVIFYAPLALNFIYSPREVDMQLLAAQQGWRLLYAYLHQEVLQGQKASDRPASAVFIHEERKVVCLAVRGTTTIHDVVTDMRQTPVPFPESEHHESSGDTLPHRPSTSTAEGEDWTTVSRGQGLAVSGMAGAAFNLYREHVDSLMLFCQQGYEICLVGHSLGGGVATLLGVLLQGDMKKQLGHDNNAEEKVPLHVYAYGTPCCIDARLSDCVNSFVTTVVLHDDVVPRLTPTSCRGLLKHLLHIRDTWVRHHLPDDLMAITERARTAWAPRWREGFTLSTSSSSIKRYCRKQLHYSRKTLLFVTDKLVGDTPSTSNKKKKKKRSPKGKIIEQEELFGTPSRDSSFETTFVSESTVEFKTSGSNEEAAEDEDKAAEAEEPEPRLLVDYMGGIDSRVEGVAIDGQEFFDTSENLVEEDESEYDEFEDAVDDPCRLEEIVPACEEETKESSTCSDKPRPTDISDIGDDCCVDDDETPGAVVLSETPLPRLYTPGKIIHIYSHRGVYKAAYVPRTFRELRRISLAGNMLTDHTCKEYYEALLEVRSVRAAPEAPPRWTAFDEDDTCSNCASRFTWASTSDSAAQAARDKHNCRSCGTLVCDPCSTNRIPLPTLGLTVPARVCDRCYNDIDGVLTGPSSADKDRGCTSQVNPDDPQQSDGLYEKPERRRERRSAVVDELASRIHASPLTAP